MAGKPPVHWRRSTIRALGVGQEGHRRGGSLADPLRAVEITDVEVADVPWQPFDLVEAVVVQPGLQLAAPPAIPG